MTAREFLTNAAILSTIPAVPALIEAAVPMVNRNRTHPVETAWRFLFVFVPERMVGVSALSFTAWTSLIRPGSRRSELFSPRRFSRGQRSLTQKSGSGHTYTDNIPV
jgi:hypothetical protein